MRRAKHLAVDSNGGLIDEMMTGMATGMMKAVGAKRLMTHDESERLMIGIPFPALSLCWLFQNDCLLFGRTLALNGLQGSGKSALLLEIARWYCLYGGIAIDIEAETKERPDVRAGIFKFDKPLLGRVQVAQPDSVQEWQGVISAGLDRATAFYGRHGKRVPLFIGLDSLTGKVAEGTAAKIDEKGFASRGFSEEALITTQFLSHISSKFIGQPANLVVIQHLKIDGDPNMPYSVSRRTPGAKSLKFTEAFEMEVTRKKYIDNVDQGGQIVGLTSRKNSYGPPADLEVHYRWWRAPHPTTGHIVQWFVWDWYDASIHMLVKLSDTKKTLAKRVAELLDLHPIKAQRRVWSRTLGIPEASPLSYHEAGRVLEMEHPALMPQLYDVLGITRRRRWYPGDDFDAVATQPIAEWRPPVEQQAAYCDMNDETMSALTEELPAEDEDELE